LIITKMDDTAEQTTVKPCCSTARMLAQIAQKVLDELTSRFSRGQSDTSWSIPGSTWFTDIYRQFSLKTREE
jgi:hypothetical protein